MSLPEFPTISPPLSREDAINQIISSIAMEELGLSHIINAEGEKLQYILGTIPGLTGPSATIEDVLKVNESVRSVLQGAAESQTLLRSKLQNALSSAVLTGPTGVTGPTGESGPATIAIGDVTRLEPDAIPTVQNTGPDGQNVTLAFGIPRGETGDTGATGATGPGETAVSLAARNVANVAITTGTTGYPIPLPDVAHNQGFTPSGTSAFSVDQTGNYLVSYLIRIADSLAEASSAVYVGGTEATGTRATPVAASDTFSNTGIVTVTATGADLELRFTTATGTSLMTGVGGSLTAVKISEISE